MFRGGQVLTLVVLAIPALMALSSRRYGAGIGWGLFALCAGAGFAAIRLEGPTWLIVTGLLTASVIPIVMVCIALGRRLMGRRES